MYTEPLHTCALQMRSQVTQPASSRAVIGACRPPAACLPRGRQCCCVHPTSEAASSVQLQQLAEAPQPGPLARSTLLRSTAAAAAAALVGWPLLLQPPAQAAIIDVMKDQAGGRTILTTSSGEGGLRAAVWHSTCNRVCCCGHHGPSQGAWLLQLLACIPPPVPAQITARSQ